MTPEQLKDAIQRRADGGLLDAHKPRRWAQFDDKGVVVSSGYYIDARLPTHNPDSKEAGE